MHRKNRSLTFGQTSIIKRRPQKINNMNPGIYTIGIQSANTFGTMFTTNGYNSQFKEIYNNLNKLREEYQQKVNDLLSSGAEAKDTLRNKGRELAWKYERAELLMNGNGTSAWNESQRQEILEFGKVRGAEGHHINNVSDHLDQQANPDNIKFAKNRQEHLDMHDGNFQNSTEGDLIDRNTRLKHTNNKRVFNNELTGLGTAIAIGLGVGFTIGFVVSLAQSGISAESVKNAAIAGGKVGAESAALGAISHVVTRGIGEMATNALQGVISNLGIEITENIIKMCNMAVMGGLTILAFSVYQFVKLRIKGYETKECLVRVGKSVAFSLTVLTLSIIAQGFWGGAAGIIVSVSTGVIILVYKFGQSQYNKLLSEKIRIYTIEKYMPIYN